MKESRSQPHLVGVQFVLGEFVENACGEPFLSLRRPGPNSFKPEDWQSDHIEIESVDEDCHSFIIFQLAAAEDAVAVSGRNVFLPDHNLTDAVSTVFQYAGVAQW